MNIANLTSTQRILRLSGFCGFMVVYALLLWLLCNWIFNRVALSKAFGSERIARERITVDHVTKPSTVTFSNGQSDDVGTAPGNAFLVCFLIGAIPYLLCGRYIGTRLLQNADEHRQQSHDA